MQELTVGPKVMVGQTFSAFRSSAGSSERSRAQFGVAVALLLRVLRIKTRQLVRLRCSSASSAFALVGSLAPIRILNAKR